MTNDWHSGSRWEPVHGADGTAEPPAAKAIPAEQGAPPRKQRPVAALTAVGLVLVGGAGGWAIGTAVAGPDTPAVQETGTDGTAGTSDGVPVPPRGGQLPDSDGDGRPDFGGRGGLPDLDGDDGPAAPDGAGTRGSDDSVDPA